MWRLLDPNHYEYAMSPLSISPGRPAKREDLLAAQERARLIRDELPRVRSAATAWRNALGALLAGLIGFGLIKGRSDVGQLAKPWAAAVGLLLLAALICGTCAALSLVRAAHGKLELIPLRGGLVRSGSDHTEARSALQALRRGVVLTIVCTALLVTAVGTTWYGSAAKPSGVEVTTPSTGKICGQLVRVSSGTLVVKTGSGEVGVRTADISQLAVVDQCP